MFSVWRTNRLLTSIRTVPTFATAYTFSASGNIRVSYGWCLLIQEYFGAV